MTKRIETLCSFVLSFKEIHWNKTTIVICGCPVVLLACLVVILIVLNAEETGGILSNSPECASVGKDALKDGGSAVDVAITMLLCEGVTLPNGAGIGGGFVALIYAGGKFDSLVATPTVPAALSGVTKFNSSFVQGPASLGVPGELKGYWEMHRKYGVLPWKRIFEPAIKLCLRGVPISRWFAGLLEHSRMHLGSSESLSHILRLHKETPFTENFKIKYISLGNTLIKIANEGPAYFYDGKLGDDFVRDVQDSGGYITKSDLKNYSVLWNTDLPNVYLKKHFKVVTMPMPTSGALITFVLNIVKHMNIETNPPLFWHRFIEAFKFAWGHVSYLGDLANDQRNADEIRKTYENLTRLEYARKFREIIRDGKVFKKQKYYGSRINVRDESGSTSICVVAPNGEVVVATTSLGNQFGSIFTSPRTGIIVNNLMSRFVDIRMEKLKSLTHSSIFVYMFLPTR